MAIARSVVRSVRSSPRHDKQEEGGKGTRREGGSTLPLFKQRQNVSNLQIMLSNSFISPSLIIQQSLTLFYGTPRPRCEWREALASCSFRHGYHVFIPLINIKTKIINKYPILIILFFCIKLIGFLLLVWTHSTFLPTDRYSARDIELVACRDGAPNRTGVAQGI